MAKSFEYSELIILIITILLLLPLFVIIKKLKPQTPPLPPSPHPWPPLLSTINHFLRPLTHSSLASLAQSHGPLIRLGLGARCHIIASSPAGAAAILRTNDRSLSARAVPSAVPLSPPQIERLSFWADPTSGGWRSIRAACRAELFSAAALEAQARRREAKAAEMVGWLRRKEGAAADVGAAAYAAVVNMFGNAFFSSDVFDLDDEAEIGKVRGLLRGIIGAISAPNLSDLFPFLRGFDLQGLRKKHRELSMKVWEIWRPVLEERRRSEIRHDDFLDSLICRGFQDDQINQLLEELFTAGVDTTAATITRTMKELIATPHSLAKLIRELDYGFGSSPIENLEYLQACMKETLRLHPPAPLMLSHRASESCHVMGHVIPKNAHVSINVWAIGRDPTVWEEPLEYRPERFLDSSSVDYKGNDFELLPFGAGRRICPGVPMAAKIVPFVVANLVYYFDWKNEKGSKVDEEFRATSLMKEPLMLIATPTPRK